MEANLQRIINKLPVLHKAHIYEPKIEDVAELAFKAGMKEVVEFLRDNCFVQNVKETGAWQAKLKEWGL